MNPSRREGDSFGGSRRDDGPCIICILSTRWLKRCDRFMRRWYNAWHICRQRDKSSCFNLTSKCVSMEHCELRQGDANQKSSLLIPEANKHDAAFVCMLSYFNILPSPKRACEWRWHGSGSCLIKPHYLQSAPLKNVFKCKFIKGSGDISREMWDNLKCECLKIADEEIFNSTLPEDWL